MSRSQDQVDMLGSFFLMNMDEFLQNVFLCLDPASLKNCRCVCKQWNCFILESIWNSRLGRARLREKLRLRWRKNSFRFSEFEINSSAGISWIGCDQTFVYYGTWNELFMRVHEIDTGILKHEVYFRDKPFSHYGTDDEICPSMIVGEDFLAVVTDVGEIILMDKLNGNLIDKLWTKGRVTKITMSKNKVIAAVDAKLGRRARISTFETMEGKWKIRSVVADDVEGAEDLQVDGDWLVIATEESSKIWKLSELEKGPVYEVSAQMENVFDRTHFVVLHFPFLFVVCPFNFQVWNIQENTMIREIKGDFITSNGDFLVVIPEDGEHPGLQFKDHDVSLQLFDIKELVNPEIPDSQLWSLTICCTVKGNVLWAVMNKTSLVIAAGLEVEVYKFWDD